MENKNARRFYSLVRSGREASLDIYGDIVGEGWWSGESDVNMYRLSRQLEQMEDVDRINVSINSYGGEVAEGIAIYNALVRHPAYITTRCDGMACSIASVIFMAGDERIMYEPSMLMIHNASSYACGDAAELRKAAEDNEKITSMSKAAYMQCVNIDEQALTALMDAETWITPAEAYEMGFATKVAPRIDVSEPSQSTRRALFDMIVNARVMQSVNDQEDCLLEDDTLSDEVDEAETLPPEEQIETTSVSNEERQEQAYRSFFMAAYE